MNDTKRREAIVKIEAALRMRDLPLHPECAAVNRALREMRRLGLDFVESKRKVKR